MMDLPQMPLNEPGVAVVGKADKLSLAPLIRAPISTKKPSTISAWRSARACRSATADSMPQSPRLWASGVRHGHGAGRRGV